ncbi:MAG TPA: TrmH family RNA methyltransferase [Gemmatimonadaceae bacterium]|nr:TrmH family RNA methyltransferase [Gemmatimonadaceae bacterium]
MTASLLEHVRVILYEPQNPINIAAVVRAMKNMGVSTLRLVRPVEYDPYRIEGIAHGTQDLIERIEHFDSFEAASADCRLLAAFTARRRAAKWTRLDPKQTAARVLEHAALGEPGALVFGREDDGLPNEILDLCQVHVSIPTTEHASLNLAQAALLALYELHLAAGDATRVIAPPRKATPPPEPADYERFFADWSRMLESIQFYKTRNAETIMRTVRSLIYRANPDLRELMLVRAMALETMHHIARVQRTAAAAPPTSDE